MQDIQVFCNTFEFMNKALSKEIMKRTRDKNKQKKTMQNSETIRSLYLENPNGNITAFLTK